MKKFLVIALCIALSSLCACTSGQSFEMSPTELETSPGEIVPDNVPEGSKEDLEVRACVSEYLDTFISADIEKIEASIHPEDQWLFNFESEDQVTFYKTIFPKIEYEFEFVAEHEGVYGVMTRIKSPNMADVYGTLITEYIDSNIVGDGLNDIMDNETERLIELIGSDSISTRDERLYIYVENIEGEYIPRCDAFLANELTGGAPEASDEISSTLTESVGALTE